jgi:hypothetical protein
MIEQALKDLESAVRELISALHATNADRAEPARDEAPAHQPEAVVVTLDDVRQALLSLGRDKAKALLAEYDVQRLPDLAPAAYPNVLAEAKRRAA